MEAENRSVHIDIDLEVQGDEVAGHAACAGRPGQEFVGWIGLIAALDALVEPPPPSRPDPVS